MLSIFGPLNAILKRDDSVTDNFTFKLHYRLTTFLLIGCSVLVTCKQFFGEPIVCFTSPSNEIPENALNTFCWMQSTFTIPNSLQKKVGSEVAYPGIDKYTTDKERTFHQYYQWVCFFLFFQAAFFYLPHFVWKFFEGGKIRQIVLGLNSPIIVENQKEDSIERLSKYLKDYMGTHNGYALAFVTCEILNFVNVLVQMYMTDNLLGGEFTTYGMDVLTFARTDQEKRIDPMIKVFPRMTKCTFHKFGPSGDVQRHDALCVLSLNVMNEKVFVFIWFWFVLLAIASAAAVVYRLVWVFHKNLRIRTLDRRHRFQLPEKFNLGDCLLMQFLHKNISPLHYRELMRKLDHEILSGSSLKPPNAPYQHEHAQGYRDFDIPDKSLV